MLSVIVTTYKRPGSLAACLDGLRAQKLQPDEVIVVVHTSDVEGDALADERATSWNAVRKVRVERPGSVPALNRGLAAAQGDIVAFVDDDAVPSVDWLERIVAWFDSDERIAGVGGRDTVVMNGCVLAAPDRRIPRKRTRPPKVGLIQWFGRMIGNHHLGHGDPCDVDVLKGVNQSYRRSYVVDHGFDERLRGPGSQVHSELSICLPLRRSGLRLIYDPAVHVMHYPAPRQAGDERESQSPDAVFAAIHNEALQILDYFGPARRLVFAGWAFAVGTTEGPGVVVLARDVLCGRPNARARFVAAQTARGAAWRTRRTPRPLPESFESPSYSVVMR